MKRKKNENNRREKGGANTGTQRKKIAGKVEKKKIKKIHDQYSLIKKKMDECNKRLERGGQNENAKQREPVSDRSEIASS